MTMDCHAMLIRGAIGPLWARWERSSYLRDYRRLKRTQYDRPEVIRARQWQTIERLLHHAYDTVPFYRRRCDECGIRPDSIRDFDDFRRLPVLTKDDLRRYRAELLSREYDISASRLKKTSGSTGVSLQVWVDEPAMQWKRACTLRSDEWSGWRFGERVAKLWGNPEYLQRGWRGRFRNAVLERASYLDTLKMHEEVLHRFAEELKRRPPSLIFGHAHSVYLFAEYLQAARRPAPKPRGIITTAMVLHDWQRRLIEKVFECRVTNRYGCEEVSLIACECEQHQGFHINADGVYVEFQRDGREAKPSEPGTIIVTDLANRAMPILRYQVGDVGVRSERVCACGRGLPLLERLEGREADYVVTARGELISGISLTENFAVLVPGVAQLQLIQESVSQFRFRIVRGDDFGAGSLERLRGLVADRFGPESRYECEYVERIPQEPSGKYRFCISHVRNPLQQAVRGFANKESQPNA